MSLFLLSSLKTALTCGTLVRNYAVKSTTGGSLMGLGKGKKGGKVATVEKIVIPVETDPHKLVNYVCGSNIYQKGEDIKIKPDNEYPDWLWEMRTEPPKISELDPTTKEYWVRVRRFVKRTDKLKKKIRKY